MPTHLRIKQIAAWLIVALFLAGFFVGPIGTWTSAIMGVWFVGTQKPLRGFVWMLAFAVFPSLFTHGHLLLAHSPGFGFAALAWLLAGATLSVLPFLIHRLISPRLPGFLSTLPLPLTHAALAWLTVTALAPTVSAERGTVVMHMLPAAYVIGPRLSVFFINWFAAALVWAWNLEFRPQRLFSGARLHKATHRSSPAELSDALALLRSPSTGEALRLAGNHGHEYLASASGERFPIRNGMPIFLRPQDLTGDNLKYNHLYEAIGGFYDDSQRVICALSGMDRDAYVMSYLGRLEIKPGDAVLETSVGTGLNFKYLPPDIRRYGLDLSAEMLANCQANLRRWQMDAALFLGNAEALPFADSSFDVVFHVGGINFFSDRAQAIREMIRVAKPGSLLLVADETEEHAKAAYENIPYTREFYKDRPTAITAPIDLVPPEMEEIRIETVWNNRFYALTFRKPRTAATLTPASVEAAAHSPALK